MIASHYGIDFDADYFRKLFPSVGLISLKEMIAAASKIGISLFGVRTSFTRLISEQPFPCIILWNQIHYVVVVSMQNDEICVCDPAFGVTSYTKEYFLSSWLGDGHNENDKYGVALLVDN
jgi:ATP-binding cassette subfamily B protein